jgi:hypothetical protein
MQAKTLAAGDVLDLRAGQLVEVRSAEEIRATLDENGELDSLPFMPEMVQYCGRQFTVYKVAHKLCDTVTRGGLRRMENAVHLAGVRCDGQAHGGCQAACLIYWKTAWLKRVDAAASRPEPSASPAAPDGSQLLPLVTIASRKPPADDGAEVYSCQATELLRAAPDHLPIRDMAQYVQDVRSGNFGVLWVSRAFLVAVFNRLQAISTRVLPRRLWFREGLRWRFIKGTATTTPTERTDLQPGELVRIKSKDEIMKTLNSNLLNRGMGFEAEMSRFCGRTARVARRVDHIIDERTGRMLHMRNPCIVLEGIVCEGAYSVNCPRAITSYWREIWLERVEAPA